MRTLRDKLLKVHEFLVPRRLDMGYTPYLWLVYNGFLLFPLIYGQVSDSVIWLTLLSLVVFLPLYFAAFRQCGAGLLPYIAAFTVLGLILQPVNQGAPVYFIHACAFAALVGPPAMALRVVGLVLLPAVVQVWWLGLHPSVAFVSVLIGLVVSAYNIFHRKMALKNEALRQSREEVKRLATTAERERIARDLHDLLGHTLAGITLKAELARRIALDDPERARTELADIERISRQAAAQVRAAVAGYRAGRVRSELASARHLLETSGVWFEYDLAEFNLTSEEENVLALALREALTNVVRHAAAGHCVVELQQDEQQTRVVVRDDGRGGPVQPGAGLSGMQERLAHLGGVVVIKPNRPGGTIVDIRLPRHPSSEAVGALEGSA